MADDVAWLLEMTEPDGSPCWLALLDKPYRGPRTGKYHRFEFTTDAAKALRFDTQVAAERYRDSGALDRDAWMRCHLDATEHMRVVAA